MMSSLRVALGSAISISLCLSGCGCAATPPPAAAEATPEGAEAAERGIVDLHPKTRSQVKGSLSLRDSPDGLSIKGKLKGVEAGSHGFTLHESGDCTAHDAKTVGPIWNPTAADPPLGILGNVVGSDETGEAVVDLVVPGLTVSGEHSVLGHAVVLHAWPLDPAADLSKVPFLACGVIEARAAL
jgi:superoxide dismutase, Cu-Zn family